MHLFHFVRGKAAFLKSYAVFINKCFFIYLLSKCWSGRTVCTHSTIQLNYTSLFLCGTHSFVFQLFHHGSDLVFDKFLISLPESLSITILFTVIPQLLLYIFHNMLPKGFISHAPKNGLSVAQIPR